MIIKSLRRIKNKIQYSYEKRYYGALDKKGLTKPLLFSTEINNNGYIIRKDVASVRRDGNLYAVVHNVIFKDMFGKELQVPYIAVDNFFDKLSDNTQKFILEHEMIHYRKHKDILLRKCERMIDLEKEADLGAAKEVGYNEALRALMEIQKVADGIINKEEIELRISFMANMCYKFENEVV